MQAMSPFKIAFFIPQLSSGGAERVVANLIAQFSCNGISVILITKDKRQNEYVIPNDVRRYCIKTEDESNNRIARYFTHVKKLKQICKLNKIDVLLSFNVPANYLATFATLGIKTKHILSVRNDPDFLFPSTFSKFFAKMFFSLADGAVFQTPDAQAWFPKKLQKKSTIILNPVSTQFFEKEYAPKQLRVITCGRLTKQKNHEMLINAFREVVDMVSDATLHIYGEGKLHSYLNDIINRLGLENNVFLEGRVTNVSEALSDASIFVLSSDVEGAPNALMEAMAVGVPSISTDCPCGGPRMLMKNNEAGLLVPVNNSKKMASAIIEMLTTPELLNRMSNKAKIEAEKFREDVVYKLWLNYINSICS